MITYSVKQARANLGVLLKQTERGEEIAISRRGREVARLQPPPKKKTPLPSMKEFRKSITIKGDSISRTVQRIRGEERY